VPVRSGSSGNGGGTVSVQLGYGPLARRARRHGRRFRRNKLRNSKAPWNVSGVTLQKAGTFQAL